MQVLVRDNNVDQALKALKKKMQREGIFREMKLRGHYEKPSEKRGGPQGAQAGAQEAATRRPAADEAQARLRRALIPPLARVDGRLRLLGPNVATAATDSWVCVRGRIRARHLREDLTA